MKLLKKIKAFFENKLNCFFYKDKFGWRHPGHTRGVREFSVSHQWGLDIRSLALGFVIGSDGDDTFSLHLSIPFIVSLYICVDTPMYKWLPYSDRRTEININDTGVFFYFWKDDMGYGKGWSGCHFIYTWSWLFMGRNFCKQVFTTEGKFDVKLHTVRHDLPPFVGYPDGVKNAAINVIVEQWEQTYPDRFYMKWYRKRFTRMDVHTDGVDVIVPGKGDNSWDQGDDAYDPVNFGSGTLSINDAVEKYVAGITRAMHR